MKKIKLGYQLDSDKQVDIPIGHMLVTGVSQYSGKTTTLESLMKRSGARGVVFRTKIGEKSFLEGNVIPPYFKDRSDWQFVKGIIEATMKQKVRSFEQAKIIQICKKCGDSLIDFKRAVDERLNQPKLNNFETDILTNIQAYLELVLPKMQSITFSKKLELKEGLNIIDLERFAQDVEVQSLIIHSVLEEILYKYKNTISILPESWKFIPQDRGSPCKLIVEEFIRQGATNNNHIWIDSQDITGIDKTPVKQITQYLLGYQAEPNEVKKTLDHLPMPKGDKPSPDEIMKLGKGKFIYASREQTSPVYIQPFWLDDERAIKVAKGEMKVEELDAPPPITHKEIIEKMPEPTAQPSQSIDLNDMRKELHGLSDSTFTRFIEMQQQIDKLANDVITLRREEVDIDSIISKVKQSLPIPKASPTAAAFDEDELIRKIMARLPEMTGKVYEVPPLKALSRKFFEEAKQQVLSDINSLNDREKKVLKYMVTKEKVTVNELVQKCHMVKIGGNTAGAVRNELTKLRSIYVVETDNKGRYWSSLRKRIQDIVGNHECSDEELDNLFDHIVMELL